MLLNQWLKSLKSVCQANGFGQKTASQLARVRRKRAADRVAQDGAAFQYGEAMGNQPETSESESELADLTACHSSFQSLRDTPGLRRGVLPVTSRRRAAWGSSTQAAEVLEMRTLLTTFTVDSLLDTPDANPGDGIAEDALGNVTLRAAVEEANFSPNTIDLIAFSDGTGSSHNFQDMTADTITLLTPLDIASELVVNGPGSNLLTLAGDDLTIQGAHSVSLANLMVTEDVVVLGTSGSDEFISTSSAENQVRLEISASGINSVVQMSDVVGDLEVDGLGSFDQIQVFGNSGPDQIVVTHDTGRTSVAQTTGGDARKTIDFENVESLFLSGGFGRDEFQVENASFPIAIDGGHPIATDGDLLILTPTAAPISSPGPAGDSGGFTIPGSGDISYDHLEAITVDLGSGASGVATIMGSGGDDDITAQGTAITTVDVQVNNGPITTYLNATDLTLQGKNGDDDFTLDVNVATLGTEFSIDGGLPTSDQDRVRVTGVNGFQDLPNWTPNNSHRGLLVLSGQQDINLENVETLIYDGENDNDTPTVISTGRFVHTPGDTIDSGTLAPDSDLALTYEELGRLGQIRATAVGNTLSTLVALGSADNDIINLRFNGTNQVDIDLLSPTGTHVDLITQGVQAYEVRSLEGDDNIHFSRTLLATNVVEVFGSGPSTSDTLKLSGQFGIDENIVISPLLGTADSKRNLITGLGTQIVSEGIELIQFLGSSADNDDLSINLGQGDDTARIQRSSLANFDIVTSNVLPDIEFNSVDVFTIDGAEGANVVTFAPNSLIGASRSMYRFNATADDTLVIEGVDGANGGDDTFIVTNPTDGSVAVRHTAGRNVTVTADQGLGRLQINSLGGDDTVTVDVDGTALIEPQISFDGGGESDLLVVTGAPTNPISEVTYSPGPATTEGRLTYDAGMTIDFDNLEPVIDTVVAATLTVNGTAAANNINYNQSVLNPSRGRVEVDEFESIEFNNKTNLVLNGGSADDTVHLNNNIAPTGLTGEIEVNGGGSTTGDVVVVSSTSAQDTIDLFTLSPDAADILGVQNVPLVDVNETESIVINGGGGNDTLDINSPAGINTNTYTPGSDVDSGDVSVDSLVPISFQNLGGAGALRFTDPGGRIDTLVHRGSDTNDAFTVDAAANVRLRNSPGTHVTVDTVGIDVLTLEGLLGDDTFSLSGTMPYQTTHIRGGYGDDTLDIDDAGAAVTVDMQAATITGYGGSVTYNALRQINAGANSESLLIQSTIDDDTVTVTPFTASSGMLTVNNTDAVLRYSGIAADTITVDHRGGEDTLEVIGNAADETIRVDGARIEASAQTINHIAAEALHIEGRQGDDTFEVDAAPIPIFVDGGGPIGVVGDVLMLDGQTSSEFSPGPESDEGTYDFAGLSTVSYDHIERVDLSGQNSSIEVSLSLSMNSGSEAGTTVITVTATASAAVSGNQTVDLGVTGTNITATDYTLSSPTITILDGQAVGDITFIVQDDLDVEGPEQATLTISNPSSGIVLGTTTTADVDITDNDATVSVSDLTEVARTAGNDVSFMFEVSLSNPVGSNVTLQADTMDGSATVADGDFDAVTAETVTIPAGSTSAFVTVTVHGNVMGEVDEEFTLQLSSLNANGQNVTFADMVAVGTILPLCQDHLGLLSAADRTPGNITATFTATDLDLTSNGDDNGVLVFENGMGDVVARGLGGSTINGLSEIVLFAGQSGIPGDMRVFGVGGTMLVCASHLDIGGGVAIYNGGTTSNATELTDVNMGGSFRWDGSSGTSHLAASNLDVTARADWDATGAATIDVTGGQFGTDLLLDTGTANDIIRFIDTQVDVHQSINTGSGTDSVTLDGTTTLGNLNIVSTTGSAATTLTDVQVDGTTFVSAGDDVDTLDISDGTFGRFLHFAGSGNNNITATGNTVFSDSVFIAAQADNDTINLTGSTLASTLTINTGDGMNDLTLQQTSITGKSVIVSGAGMDELTFTDAGFGTSTFVMTGSGNDNLNLVRTTFDGLLAIHTEADDDTVISDTMNVAGTMAARLGAGTDSITVSNGTFQRSVNVEATSDSNTLNLTTSTFSQNLNVNFSNGPTGSNVTFDDVQVTGSSVLSSGIGRDTFNLTNGSVFGGSFLLNTGNSNDTITASDTTFDGSLVVSSGEGQDVISLTDVSANSSLTLNSGLRADTLELLRTDIVGKTNIVTDSGNDILELTDVGFGTTTFVNTGSQNDAVTLLRTTFDGPGNISTAGGDDSVTADTVGTTASLTIDLGAHDDTFDWDNLTSTGSLIVQPGLGDDAVRLLNSNISVGSTAFVPLGGNNVVDLQDNVFATHVTVATNNGAIALRVKNNAFQSTSSLFGGNGLNDVFMDNSTNTFGASPTISRFDDLTNNLIDELFEDMLGLAFP